MKKITKVFISVLTGFYLTTSLSALDLQQVTNQLAKHPITTGTFSQVKTMSTAKGNRNLKSSGSFIFSLDGIMWKTEKPFPSSIAVTKKAVIQTAADGTTTVIDTSGNQVFASIASSLTAVFSNDLTELQKIFNTDFAETKDGWTITLTPKDSTIVSSLKSIKMTGISDSDYATLNSIQIQENESSSITYNFQNHKYPQELTADEKNFFTSK